MGVIPTRMMPMGVRKKAKSYPWDYRVAYFQSDGSVTGFIVSQTDLIPGYDGTPEMRAAINSSFARARLVVAAPLGANSGDRKLMGTAKLFGAARYKGKWRPCGWNAWPTQPTATELPFYSDTPVLFEWTPGYWEISIPSAGEAKKAAYTQGGKTYRDIGVCMWDTNQASYSGTRFYSYSASFPHPTNPLEWDLVPCVKDNTQYICNRLTGMLYPKTGNGTITNGPQVADDYDAITNP